VGDRTAVCQLEQVTMTSQDNNSTAPKPKLRWFQYSLSTIFLVMTTIAIFLSIWTDRVRKQKKAVEFILQHGGAVEYSYQVGAGRAEPTPPGPQWLRDLLGIDYLDHVTSAWFVGDIITDADMEHLRGLQDLESLQVYCANVTDAGLGYLKYVRHLKGLELRSGQITDAGLAHLQPLGDLTELTLECSLTAACTKHLLPLKKLSKLRSLGYPSFAERLRAIEALPTPTIMEFFNTPLPTVCEYLGNYHDMKVQIDKAALNAAKIDADDIIITIKTKNVKLTAALHSLLYPFGLDWYVGQDGLVITTKEIAAKKHQSVEELQKALPNLKQAYVDW
jgi:hypothetical protein